jgi:hypothetical protein
MSGYLSLEREGLLQKVALKVDFEDNDFEFLNLKKRPGVNSLFFSLHVTIDVH